MTPLTRMTATLAVALSILIGGRLLAAAPAENQVTIMAAKLGWSDPKFSGYAFLCIGQSAGGSEDCFAFYPRGNGKGAVGGPKVELREFVKTPSRFPSPAASVTRRISDEQQRSVVKAIDVWNDREYALTETTCMELVRNLAELAGFYVPPRKNESPEGFVRRLATFNGR